MKKVIYFLLICSLLVAIATGCSSKAEPGVTKVAIGNVVTSSEGTYRASEQSKEELHQDIFVTLLNPYIQKALNDYYEKFLTTSPNYSPEYVEVLDIKRPMGNRSFSFIIKLQVKPYVGPHVYIGIDQLTISVGSGEGEVKIEKFEHIKSYYDELPPNLKGILKDTN